MKMEKFKPTWYWTGDIEEDARLINMPDIEKEGIQEDRIEATIQIMKQCSHIRQFTFIDMLNIQNMLLNKNNWRGIKPGIRDHTINFTSAHYKYAEYLTQQMFPIHSYDTNKDLLLAWYETMMVIHPLSDLNGRVFGIIVSLLYRWHKLQTCVD